eukprot:8910019-Pyramimonas_sp.AAC.1
MHTARRASVARHQGARSSIGSALRPQGASSVHEQQHRQVAIREDGGAAAPSAPGVAPRQGGYLPERF